jgi:predicted O-linked N-acetylglucosamine transferase (SPINDLY family)
LPANGFVFCSLNNNYKYTAEMFDVWMRILQRTPGSVMLLLSDSAGAQGNLIREAAARGVDANRLVFATRALPPDYLARYAVVDLFLDTFPFNAGSTANDALWMGLPVLTYTGRSFASRMAGALLTAAEMPELITYNLADYEEKAVALAMNPQECQRLRNHLKEVHDHGVLFDTPRFVRNLENRLQKLVAEL